MTVEVERDALMAALRQVSGVVAARTTIPVLGNLLFAAEGGQLAITGTDLDLQATATVEAAGSLRTTVPADKMVAAVTSLKPGRIAIAMVEGRAAVILKQGRSQRTISVLSADDFPNRPALEGATTFSIAKEGLLRLFDACHVAQSTEEARYYLNGVFLHVADGKLRGVATDGHRLVRAEIPCPDGADALPDTIVRTKLVALLRTLLPKGEGAITMAVTAKAVDVRFGTVRIVASNVEGTFPDYTRVIPPECARRLEIARDGLIEPVAAVAAVVNAEGDQKVRTVVFDLGTDGGHEVNAKDSTGAYASEPLDGELIGDPLRIGVNHQYLKTVAGIFAESSMLTLWMDSPTAPIRVAGNKDPDLIAVIMPMRA